MFWDGVGIYFGGVYGCPLGVSLGGGIKVDVNSTAERACHLEKSAARIVVWACYSCG